MIKVQDTAMQITMQLTALLDTPGITDDQIKSISKAVGWLNDVTQPLTVEEQQFIKDHKLKEQLTGLFEEAITHENAQTLTDNLTVAEWRKGIEDYKEMINESKK